MKSTYPQYKINTWIDTSPESFAKKSPDKSYGIDKKRFKGDQWWHLSKGGEALFFDTIEQANAAIEEMKNGDGA